MSEPREGVGFFTREYEQRLILAVAEEIGLPVALQPAPYRQLAAKLAEKGLRIVQVTGELSPIKVERVIEGKDQGNLLNIYKG